MTNQVNNTNKVWCLLTIALVCVLLGRAYQCFFWDIPIRSLLWSEDLMTGTINSFFGIEWNEYLKHPKANTIISSIVSSIGFVLVASLGMTRLNQKRIRDFGFYLGAFTLIFIAFLYHLEKFKTAGQFFEYSLQFLTPIICCLYLKDNISGSWKLLAKVAIALTFTNHGLYALGFYPVPGNFVAMTIQILHCSDATAITFLRIAGIVDILASIGIFFSGRIFKWSIWYCIIWGALTALARIVANVYLGDFIAGMHQWAFETLYRVPHFLIPFTLWITEKDRFIEKE